MFIVFLLIELAIIALVFISMWKIFEKAGRPGWEGIVPIYNIYILITKIVNRPWWWLILCLIPIVSIVALIVIMLDLAKVFGQSTGFAVGLILLGIVFLPLLAFGPAKYVGAGGGGQGFPVQPTL